MRYVPCGRDDADERFFAVSGECLMMVGVGMVFG